MLCVLLDAEVELATHTLEASLRYLTFALCRLPSFHDAVMTPPALLGDGTVSERILDQALMESEVCSYDIVDCSFPMSCLLTC